MSRTTRRGKPSRNFARYNRIGVIHHENQGYFSHWTGEFGLTWCEGDGKTYDEYAMEEIRLFHADYRNWYSSVPRVYRKGDIAAQKAQHLQAIRVALSTGDYDVCLTAMSKYKSWAYH